MDGKRPVGIAFCLAAVLATPGSARGIQAVPVDTIDSPTVRIGSIDGDGPFRLSEVMGLAVERSAETVWVVDRLENCVMAFDWHGNFVRAWGGAGDGPGEFSGPLGLAVARDTVVVIDNGRVHAFSREGESLISFPLVTAQRVSVATHVWAHEEGWVLEVREVENRNQRHRRLYRLDLADRRVELPHAHQLPPPEALGDPLAFMPMATVSSTGAMLELRDREMRVSVVDDAAPESVYWEQDITPVAYPPGIRARRAARVRDECERSRAIALCLSRIDEMVSEWDQRGVPERRPVLSAIVPGRDGGLLLQREDTDDTPLIVGDSRTWELIDDQRRWRRTLVLPAPLHHVWWDSEDIWGVTRDEFDVPYLVRLSIPSR